MNVNINVPQRKVLEQYGETSLILKYESVGKYKKRWCSLSVLLVQTDIACHVCDKLKVNQKVIAELPLHLILSLGPGLD